MPNVSRSDRDGFDRVPRRGVVSLVATVIGLVLLVNFRTPDDSASATGADLPPVAVVGRATPTPTSIPRETQQSDRNGGPNPTTEPPQPTAKPQGAGKEVVDGPEVDNPYGPVQVEITLQGRRLVDLTALQLPSDRRFSRQISDYVGPILRQEALKAQSANIDIISGATFTSEAYARSLQAALDTAQP